MTKTAFPTSFIAIRVLGPSKGNTPEFPKSWKLQESSAPWSLKRKTSGPQTHQFVSPINFWGNLRLPTWLPPPRENTAFLGDYSSIKGQ